MSIMARMLKRLVLLLFLITFFAPFAAAQRSQGDFDPAVSGGPFLGGGAFFNTSRNTSDLALEMGGMADFRLRERLGLALSAGFMANVSDNDAYSDRTGLYTAGLRYSFSSEKLSPFVSGGYALGSGEGHTHHFGFAGTGVRYWYGERIGVQFEVRDYLTSDINFLQGRITVLLR